MRFLTAAVTLFASFALETTQNCYGYEKEDLLQSGTIQFVNSGNSQQETCHNVNVDFAVPGVGLQVAVSATDLYKYRPKGGLDYSVRGGVNQKGNGVTLSLLAGDTTWSKVSASYLASGRNDIIAGSFIADTFELFGCDKKSVDKATIKHSIPHFSGGNYQIATFVSGLKTLDRYVNLNIEGETLSNAGDIQVKITSNANPSIENIYINYVAWERRAPFVIKTFSDLSNAIGNYYLAGVKDFGNSLGGNAQGVNIFANRLTCVGTKCPSGCIADQNACKRLYGYVSNGVCIACAPGENYVGGQCVPSCKDGERLSNGKCISICGANEIYKNGQCICADGYFLIGGNCIGCPSGSYYQNGKCVCTKAGYWFDQAKFACLPEIPTCPPRSKWNQNKLACQCTYSNQHLIGNLCQPCGSNEGWNGQSCVCISDYFKVNGVCQKCVINSTYNGRECVCNHGFFDNRGKCDACHYSCGKCSGPGAHQCTSCSDVSYTFKNGYCTRGTPCPTGLYLDVNQCKACSSYCDTCTSQDTCDKCIDGFKIEKIAFGGKYASYCTEICGDGKRFELDCDDGNTRNNDGCNAQCEVENGYTCQGGSSIKPSNCVGFSPERSYIQTTGTTHLFGRIVQGIRLSYLPPSLTANECALCSKVLWIRVINSSVVPGIRVNYLPKSKYQFMAEFEFNGLFSIPVFSFTVQINPDFAKYFNTQDMTQIEVKKVDPALLIKHDVPEALTLDDEIYVPDNLVPELFP